ncbi:hypothetical protein RND81_07G056700 [Saponaria officinalis]|uniref:Uncharacterized protein n=1 Tax=Saponaria officinalis TaxID=3572 RepID=A0AAW1JMH1_SAPOF
MVRDEWRRSRGSNSAVKRRRGTPAMTEKTQHEIGVEIDGGTRSAAEKKVKGDGDVAVVIREGIQSGDEGGMVEVMFGGVDNKRTDGGDNVRGRDGEEEGRTRRLASTAGGEVDLKKDGDADDDYDRDRREKRKAGGEG